MSKEQEIINGMLSNCWKFKDKWYVKSCGVRLAIKDAGYTDEQAVIIIKRMEAKGIIKRCTKRKSNYDVSIVSNDTYLVSDNVKYVPEEEE